VAAAPLAVVRPIPSTTSLTHLTANVAAARIRLTEGQFARLGST
jgi:aryl-alcohol dehydrogenase-like predicted oxidoreductase